VLKDLGESEFYRSSVQLSAMDLSKDFEGYFAASEQVPTRVAIAVERAGPEPLGGVAGVLVQALPGADPGAIEEVGEALAARLEAHVAEGKPAEATALLEKLLPGFALQGTIPVGWRCSCSKEKVLLAISSLGKAELMDMLEKQGGASADCQFCGKRHLATADDLKQLIAAFEG
jgi:molecular chaperone Hsp33